MSSSIQFSAAYQADIPVFRVSGVKPKYTVPYRIGVPGEHLNTCKLRDSIIRKVHKTRPLSEKKKLDLSKNKTRPLLLT